MYLYAHFQNIFITKKNLTIHLYIIFNLNIYRERAKKKEETFNHYNLCVEF